MKFRCPLARASLILLPSRKLGFPITRALLIPSVPRGLQTYLYQRGIVLPTDVAALRFQTWPALIAAASDLNGNLTGRVKRTIAKIEWLLSFACPTIGNHPIKEIGAPDILRVLRYLEVRGRHESVRRLRTLSSANLRTSRIMMSGEPMPEANTGMSV
jgi:hypothetical protein